MARKNSRPYFRKTIAELSQLFKAGDDDARLLKTLSQELLHRKTPSATKLRHSVYSRLRSLNNNSTPSTTRKTNNSSTASDTKKTPHTETKQQINTQKSGKVNTNLKIRPQSKSITMSSSLPELDQLRKRLLDLSARNRLLHFPHGRGALLRVIDELPDQLFQLLATDKELRFLPVPDPRHQQLVDAGFISVDEEGKETVVSRPNAQQWAKYLGLNTNFEVPKNGCDEKHQDSAIQTLLFPGEMESKLRSIRTKARSLIEETGANALYMAFGFLEWHESDDSKTIRQAPLFLVPVQLERGKLNKQLGTYEYRLKASGEEIINNLSLREKLRIDFGMALPALEEDDSPETYLKKVEDILHSHPSWRVRRYITLSLFNFSKLLMFLDLDPERWPERSITSHELVRKFFEGTSRDENSGNSRFLGEHKIDDIPTIHSEFPLIDDADSSQHSALIDAVAGQNLVIEGPPGSGKSQTITNLIAAALLQGKKVLFMAEKLAALEVVRRRLNNAGLGDFCLELHSHTSQKTKVLADIKTRINNGDRFRPPIEIETTIRRYEDLKHQLRDHAETINKNWGKSERRIHQILSTAVRYKQKISVKVDAFLPTELSTSDLTPYFVDNARDTIKSFEAVFPKVAAQLQKDGTIQSHPWYGINDTSLQHFDIDTIVGLLQKWQDSLTDIQEALSTIGVHLSLDEQSGLKNIEKLYKDIQSLPELHGDEYLDCLPELNKETLIKAEGYLFEYRNIQLIFDQLSKHIHADYLKDLDRLERLKLLSDELTNASKVNFGAVSTVQSLSLHELTRHQQSADIFIQGIKEVESLVSDISQQLGKAFDCSYSGLINLKFVIHITSRLSAGALRLREELFDNDELDEALPSLKKELGLLKKTTDIVEPVFKLNSLPNGDQLAEIVESYQAGGFLRWFKSNWRAAKQQLFGLLKDSKYKNELSELSKSILNYQRQKEKIDSNNQYMRLLGKNFQGDRTDIDLLISLREWYKAIRSHFGVGFGASVHIGDTLLNMPASVAKGLGHLAEQDTTDRLDLLIKAYDSLENRFPKAKWVNNHTKLLTDSDSSINLLAILLGNALKAYEQCLLVKDIDLKQVQTLFIKADVLRNSLNSWLKSDIDEKLFNSALMLQPGPGNDLSESFHRAIRTCKWARHLNNTLDTPGLTDSMAALSDPECIVTLRELGICLGDAFKSQEIHLEAFSQKAKLNTLDWVVCCGNALKKLISRNQFALKHKNWLSNWTDYIRFRERSSANGFGKLIRAVEKQEIPVENLQDAFWLSVNEYLARDIIRTVPALAQFSGITHEELQKQFVHYDNKLKQLQRQKIANVVSQNFVPKGRAGGRASERSGLGLIEAEVGKKTRHIPIRQMVDRAGDALVALKPCFMMGPMSVAQYLKPGAIEFDLIIMDEASQMKPEDALGSIARGKQLVVVGDPKQLPPTSFFDKTVTDEDDDDLTGIEESESILDAASVLFNMRRLRWHYRSRHESLIAFSNHAFYNSDLVVFPSPTEKSDELGVKFTRVKGRFSAGGNRKEAIILAEAVENHLLNHPCESLGVVAMNAKQSEQIERAIEERLKDNPRLQHAYEKNLEQLEPLFIKNLENVQGDERDVIFISFTYGPIEVGGKVPQRFGPINRTTGWRRLNVLFTRSKKRMHIFSSMGAGDIVVTENSNKSIHALRDFLAYAETGRLTHTVEATGRGPGNDFEISVMNALQEHGYACQPQLGIAEYFLDVAVRDPGSTGKYLMGIECDGATYHSAKSTRDRDRLRQEVLQGLGWNIRRIWSTDWFKNPQAVLEPIISELNQLKTEPIAQATPHEESELEYVEEIVENRLSGVTEINEECQQEKIEATEPNSLKAKLERYDEDFIHRNFPNTDHEARLLRPAMIEALLEFMPTSRWEFQENIPGYLRTATDTAEAKIFLQPVLDIIDKEA